MPFKMRLSSTSFMQRLPQHIQKEIQSIADKKAGLIVDSIHRFWIQAGSVKYERVFRRGFLGLGQTNENIMTYYIGDDIQMSVKKHRMKYDEQGNLIDDKTDNDEQSAEAEFARIFTKYY
ncbi:unnamed protein product, partial [Didymodactylos carnosus]